MHVGIATGFANHSEVDDTQFVREELTQLELAAELGFESVWITEHHFSSYSISPNPLMYLSYLAGRHPRVRLGTQVLVVPWHDPVRMAEEILLLDHVSGGRALIGFGRGLSRMEYEGMRIDQNEARQRFDESVTMVLRAFETGVIEGGGLFKQPRRELRPRPIRPLRGRAFCAAGSPASMVSAAKLGLGRLYLGQPMVAGHVQSDSGLSRVVGDEASDAWLKAWHEAHPGEEPVAPFVSNIVFIDESGDRARELARVFTGRTFAAAVKNYEMTSEHHGTIKGYEAYSSLRMTPEEAQSAIENAHKSSIAGTPNEVLEQLQEVKQRRQPQGMIPHLYTGGMPHEECLRSVRLFAEKCLNEVKSWSGATLTIDGLAARAAL